MHSVSFFLFLCFFLFCKVVCLLKEPICKNVYINKIVVKKMMRCNIKTALDVHPPHGGGPKINQIIIKAAPKRKNLVKESCASM